mmetsp:Transcript_45830/g.112374  ORF Transcript_45830/g.112374 Transcript_45830/m.112374 type:complete len:357 (+) Transcript_45830:64-1134(+)
MTTHGEKLATAPFPPVPKVCAVTGAAGFVGFHTTLALRARGDAVVGVDNFNDYYDVALKRERARVLADEHDVHVLDADVCDAERVRDAIVRHRVTHVLHLAAQAGVRYSLEHPLAYVRANVECFVTLLEVLRTLPRDADVGDGRGRAGADATRVPLVYASSSSVYGLNTKVPFSEYDEVVRPASLYAATKRENELIAHVYHNLYGVRTTGLRFFTVYGPYGRPDMAYYSFSRAIVDGKPIQVYAHGKVARDFTYVDDIVRGVVAAIDLSAERELFNLGGSKPHSVMELIEALERHLGREARKNFTDAAAGDVPITYADLTHARERLGYEPRVSLDDGIARFMRWFKRYHNVPDAST